jgi:hypothetical protein
MTEEIDLSVSMNTDTLTISGGLVEGGDCRSSLDDDPTPSPSLKTLVTNAFTAEIFLHEEDVEEYDQHHPFDIYNGEFCILTCFAYRLLEIEYHVMMHASY